jgi:hypothetical protein
MLDGYRKKPLHPFYKTVMADVAADTPPLGAGWFIWTLFMVPFMTLGSEETERRNGKNE